MPGRRWASLSIRGRSFTGALARGVPVTRPPVDTCGSDRDVDVVLDVGAVLATYTISAPAGPWIVAPGEAQRNPGIWGPPPDQAPKGAAETLPCETVTACCASLHSGLHSVTPLGFDIAMAIVTPGCASLHPGLHSVTPSGFEIAVGMPTPGCAALHPGLHAFAPSGLHTFASFRGLARGQPQQQPDEREQQHRVSCRRSP